MGGRGEFAKAALDALGKSAPWIIIGGLAAFGVYKVQEITEHNLSAVQSIEEKERSQARQDFEASNKALKDTYDSASKLYGDMMTSMGESLKQLQGLEQEIRDKQKDVFQSQMEVQTAKLALESRQNELSLAQSSLVSAQKELSVAREDAAAAQKEADAARKSKLDAEAEVKVLSGKLAEGNAKLADAVRDLETTNRQAVEKRNELNQAVARLSEATGLVNDVINLPQSPSAATILALRQKAEAFAPGMASFLDRFYDDRESRSSLDPSPLAGLHFDDLRRQVNDMPGMNWYVSIDEGFGPDAHPSVVVAAIPEDEEHSDYLNNILIITIGSIPSDALDRDKRGFSNVTKFIEKLEPANPAISGAVISPAFVYQCWNPSDSYNSTALYKISSNRSSSTSDLVGDDIDILDYLQVFSFSKFKIWKGGDLTYKVLSPRTAVAMIGNQLGRFSSSMTECLEFYKEREFLANTQIMLDGLMGEELQIVQENIRKMYKSIFNSAQDFTSLSIYPAARNNHAAAAFMAALAHVALQKRSTSEAGRPAIVTVIAQKAVDGLTLDIKDRGQIVLDKELQSSEPVRARIVAGELAFVPR